MTVFLLVKQSEFTFLVRQEEHLVVNDHVSRRYAVNSRYEVNRHGNVVYLNICIRTDNGWGIDTVHIHETIYLATSVAHGDSLIVHLEVGHRHNLVAEVHGEIAVNILSCSFAVKIG